MMYTPPPPSRILHKVNRNATTLFILAVFFCLGMIIYLSTCSMPCEYASNELQMERESLQSVFSFHKRYAPRKAHNAFLTILVVTGPKYFERRDAMRQTWLSGLSDNTLRFFSIGTKGLSSEEIATLEYEQSEHKDLILMPDVHDAYSELTEKLVQSFAWIDANVDTKYVFKCDDDTFARLDVLIPELGLKVDEGLYWGFFDGRARVKKTGQWAEKSWLLCDTYLPHARGGGYVLSYDLVHYIVRNSRYLQRFNSEDISVGAWLGPLSITRVHDPRFDTEYVSRGCYNDYIVTHKQNIEQMREKHRNLQTTGKLCKKEYRDRLSYVYNWSVAPSQCCIRNDSSIT